MKMRVKKSIGESEIFEENITFKAVVGEGKLRKTGHEDGRESSDKEKSYR